MKEKTGLSLDDIVEEPVKNIGGKTTKELDFFSENKKWHLHRILIIALWAMFLIAGATLTVRAVHFILPDQWCWLTAEKLQNIDKFLFSGAFGGILAKYARFLFASS